MLSFCRRGMMVVMMMMMMMRVPKSKGDESPLYLEASFLTSFLASLASFSASPTRFFKISSMSL